MKNLFRISVMVLAVMLAAGVAFAEKIHLQGVLYDANGFPITAQNKPATMQLYDANTAGNAVGSPYSLTLNISQGAFSATVDLGNLVVDKQLFAQLDITGVAPQSRIPLSAPYALRAGTVSNVSASKLTANGDTGVIFSNAPRSNVVFNGITNNITTPANLIGSEGYWALRTALLDNSFNLDVFGRQAGPALTVLQDGRVNIGGRLNVGSQTTPALTVLEDGRVGIGRIPAANENKWLVSVKAGTNGQALRLVSPINDDAFELGTWKEDNGPNWALFQGYNRTTGVSVPIWYEGSEHTFAKGPIRLKELNKASLPLGAKTGDICFSEGHFWGCIDGANNNWKKLDNID